MTDPMRVLSVACLLYAKIATKVGFTPLQAIRLLAQAFEMKIDLEEAL